jgi:RNA polymerase sigma-70 factor (ECF subfamily)
MCVNQGPPEAWEEFLRRTQPLFARIAWRMALQRGRASRDEVDDLVQEICLKISAHGAAVLRKLPGQSDEAAFAYLKVVAANTVRDRFDYEHAGQRDAARTSTLDDDVIGRLGTVLPVAEADKRLLLAQVDGALGGGRRERTIFWLYYRTGLTAKEIAALPSIGLGESGVESLLNRQVAAVRHALLKRSRPQAAAGEGKTALDPS